MRYLWYIYNKFTNEVEMSFINESDCKKYFDEHYNSCDCIGEQIFSYSRIDSFSAVKFLLNHLDGLDDILIESFERELYER